MAQDSDEPVKTPAEETAAYLRLRNAVALVRGSSDLREFLRGFLSFCHALPPSSVFTADPVLNAYNQGVQSAGLELMRLLTSADPMIVPALLVEELTHEE